MKAKLIDAIKSLRPITKYARLKNPDWRKIVRAIDAARYAPMANNMACTKFIVTQDPDKISKIESYCQQEFVKDAKYVVIAITNDSALKKSYGDRGVRYGSQLGGAAIQNFLLSINGFGYGTKWVQYFHEDRIKHLFGIPDPCFVEGVFPIGVPAKGSIREPKKIDLENFVYFEKWKRKEMDPKVIIKPSSN